LIDSSPMRFLVASRLRPRWRTARKLVYGELFELDRTRLAMTPTEARSVLAKYKRSPGGVIEAAGGWPAIIGLAAVSTEPLPEDDLPQALHDYLAEELLDAVEPHVGLRVAQLSLIPGLTTPRLAAVVLGDHAREILTIGERLGFIVPRQENAWEMHPLIRSFLRSKLRLAPSHTIRDTAAALAWTLLEDEAWDDAFSVISFASLDRLVPELFGRALAPLLRAGRVETLRQWLDHFSSRGIESPLLDLGRAELAARSGLFARSEVYARRALRNMPDNDRRAELHLLRGRNAILSDHYEEALSFYQEAAQFARRSADRRAALWGEFVARRYLEQEEVEGVVETLAEIEDDTPEGVLRV